MAEREEDEQILPEVVDREGEEENSFLEEAEELTSIITRVVDGDGSAAAGVYDRYKAILYKYQEQSQLLDAYLERIVQPLAGLLREQAMALNTSAAASGDAKLQHFLGVCRLLNVLVIVRGYKTVVKFFPHEAADLETVLHVLMHVKAQGAQPKSSEEGLAVWEAQSILLLWLSILILIPFELATVDTEAALETGAGTRESPYTILVGKVLDLCKDYLHHPGGVREMAALLLGRLLTRPDMGPALSEFLTWSEAALKSTDTLKAPFLVPGVLQALCFVFKLGQRARLLPHTPRVWAQLVELHAAAEAAAAAGSSSAAAGGAGGVLARKLAVKLGQRVGLTFLEPRLAPWRYTREDAGDSLDARLGAGLEEGAAPGADTSASSPSGAAGGAAARGQASKAGAEQEEEEEEYELVEEVEEVLSQLLAGLRDRDTIVRWSAAKGVGRVTGCLPKELGDEVVASVLELFKPTESDTAWHGGCLALAELARRGLLLPERLPALTPLIRQALLYDVRRGPHSIGAHVRDAAAYVCWAFARAYAPSVMADHVTVLAATLLTVAVYDREVNCRRAAAAAFQEAVGRLGNFPHGIDLLTVADYFSVGSITQAYTSVAPAVAAYPEYTLALVDHLAHTQLRHWEKALRELAAKGLAALVPAAGQYLATDVLDALLPRCLDPVLEVRHGAVVGIAELLPALHAAGVEVSAERVEKVAGLVPAIDKARLYRGKGGEVLREAVSKLVAGCAAVGLRMIKAQHMKVHEALDENLRHPHQHIQRAAVAALGQYTGRYVVSAEQQAGFARYVDAYLTSLHDANVAVRRGYAQALGALPRRMLAPRAEEVLDALADGTVPEEDPDERDVESRAACVRALGCVCTTLLAAGSSGSSESQHAGEAEEALSASAVTLLGKVYPCLHTALADYTTDNRGDVGSWVREGAMNVLVTATQLLAGLGPEEAGKTEMLQSVAPGVAAALLKQAVERIARVRESAIRHLCALLANPTIAAALPAAEALRAALPTDDADLAGIVSLEAVRRLSQLVAAAPAYSAALLEGLVASIGGVDAQLAKVASAALLEALASGEAAGAGVGESSSTHHGSTASAGPGSAGLSGQVAGQFVDMWQRHAKSGRMAGPLLRTADLLVTRAPGVLASQVVPPPPKPAGAGGAEEQAQGGGAAAAGAAGEAAPALQPLPDVLVGLARAETRQCTDVARLLDAATLLCHLLPCANPCRTSAYQGLLVLLVSRYPKVRRHAAEQLYLALLALEPSETGGPEGGVDAEAAEAAQDVVLTTTWDGDLEAAKAARDALAGHLQVKVPAMKTMGAGAGAKKAAKDEYASYQSLLDDFARGV